MTKKKFFTALSILLISIVARFILPSERINQKNIITASPAPANNALVKVVRAIDGDTVEIETGQRVRYIGADTPERNHRQKKLQCFGKEAYEKNKQLVEGKTVRLEKDVSETDRFGRLLRYVFLNDTASTNEGVFINKYLIAEGYAHAATFPPDVKYADEFKSQQQNAMIRKKGLWNACR